MKNIIIFIFLIFTISILAQEKRDELFDEVKAILDQANEDNADILCSANYNSALKYYLNAKNSVSEGESPIDIRDNLESSITYLTKMNDSIDKKHELFAATMEIRNTALANSADKNAGYFWNLAEDGLKEVIDKYDDGDLNSAINQLVTVDEYYSTSILYSKKANILINNTVAENNAIKNLANILAPEYFKKGETKLYSTLDAIYSGEKLSEIDKMISDLDLLFGEASKQAIRYKDEFSEVIAERGNAKIVEADKYTFNIWKDAEELLLKSAGEFEDKNFEKANELALEATVKYSEAKHTSLKDYFLNNARIEIDKAINENAEKYAPITLKRSKDYLAEVSSLIENDSYSMNKVKTLADITLSSAKNARYITSVAKRMKPGEHSWEEIILSQQGKSYMPQNPIQDNNISDKERSTDYFPDFNNYESEDAEVIDESDKEVLRLTKVNFSTMSTKLNKQSMESLNRIAKFLKNYQNNEISIFCYTDNVGTKSMNKALSQKRAEAVFNYLKRKGNFSQLVVDGRGEENPIASNATATGRRKNRRIEIEIKK